MTWEEKTELVKLGNAHLNSPEDKKVYQDFVLENVDRFDNQAWSMFVNITEIIADDMKTDLDYWKVLYPKLDCNMEGLNFRDAMRMSLIEVFCEEELHLTR